MQKLLFITLFLIVLLNLTAIASADQNDMRLETLFTQLKESPDVAAAQAVEAQIWEIWLVSGRNDIDELMREGVEAMNRRLFDQALEAFDQIVQLAPEFAEGWNKRATVYYLRDELPQSVEDVQRTLTLEPRHFGAISGMGLIFMQIGDQVGALKAFEDVLKLYPQSPSAQYHSEKLRARLKGQAI